MDKNNLDNTQNLELLLDKINKEFSDELVDEGKIEEDEVEILSRLQTLYKSMKEDTEGSKHYTLSELKKLVKDRKSLNDEWIMPDHLVNCGYCLEAFQILLEGIPDIDTQTFHCFVDQTVTHGFNTSVFADMETRPSLIRHFTWKRIVATAIAAAVVIISAFFIVSPKWRLFVKEGILHRPNQSDLQGRIVISGNTLLYSQRIVNFVIEGRYQFILEPDTELYLRKTNLFSNRIPIEYRTGSLILKSLTSTRIDKELEIITPFASVTTTDASLKLSCQKRVSMLTPLASDSTTSRSASGADRSEEDKESVVSVSFAVKSGTITVIQGNKTVVVKPDETAVISDNNLRIVPSTEKDSAAE